jgi:3-hydroxyisobutyrate dehydrogenase-like beta-hydroxyacid dehydrogenase
MASDQKRVTVLGLGLLGSAMARAFLDNGYQLTVWNRSPARASAFDGIAGIASSVPEACRASEVIIACMIDPSACDSVLRHPETEAAIRGKLLVQLTTTTPADARSEAEWANRCGAQYLGGAILASPSTVGTDRAMAFYSGPREAFDRYRSWLQVLAPNSVYYGEEIGRAATMDHALLELSYGCLAVLFHSMALCEAGSVPLDEFLDHVTIFKDGFLEQRTSGIASGTYPSGTATMYTFTSWVEQLVRVAADAGVDTSLPAALLHGITRTVELGHGRDDYQALYEAFRQRGNDSDDQLPPETDAVI